MAALPVMSSDGAAEGGIDPRYASRIVHRTAQIAQLRPNRPQDAVPKFLIVRIMLPTSASMGVQRFLIGLGLLILIVGIAWPILSRSGLGRLPGDIMIQRGSTMFYFPLVTCIVISVVLSALFWLFNR